MIRLIQRIRNSIRWRLGLPSANELLQEGTDESVSKFYNDRVTYCEFVTDPAHYEYPRFEWLIKQIKGNDLLEIGCGDGGMTDFFSNQVNSIVAMDVSRQSLDKVDNKKLPNVTTVESLIENYTPGKQFEWIVMSEVIEHLRNPGEAVAKIYEWLAPGGTLLITTPHGYWESDEHLQEFSTSNFFTALNAAVADSITIGFLRDNQNRRRWLTGRLEKSLTTAAPDDFFSRKLRLEKRKPKR